jgi:hypothetical protein
MAFFKKINNKPKELALDTSNFFLGAPEAEGESTINSRMKLDEVFDDYLEIFPELEHEKFIISGRKGSGKSAIGEHIFSLSLSEPTTFVELIKKGDINLEEVIQIGDSQGHIITKELFFEWVILIKLIKLITQNQALLGEKEIKLLKEFLKKNSGFVDIRGYELKEIITKKGFELNIESFRRFFAYRFSKTFDLKGEKAPFYKLIPHLRETVLSLLKSPANGENEYILIFDDLDVGFKVSNPEHIISILNLLRVSKNYNLNFFGKNGISAKIILLLRDDIADVLSSQDADTYKMLSTYGIPLIWYKHQLYKVDENLLMLKKFINKRIEINFKKNNLQFNDLDPWSSLIDPNDYYTNSSFKYVVDHTFYRPRDLILFFKPLAEFKFTIPLKKENLNSLLGRYCVSLVEELKNELTAHFNSREIIEILRALQRISHMENFSYEILLDELSPVINSTTPESAIEILFNLSMIGNEDPNYNQNLRKYFKHYQEEHVTVKLREDFYFIFPPILKIYFRNQ